MKKNAPKTEPPSFGKIPIVKEPEPPAYAIPLERFNKEKTPAKEDLPAYVPRIEPPREPSPSPKKEKKIPPIEHRNPAPMGVFPRSRVHSQSKKLTSDDEDSRANSAMSNVTDSEAEREKIKPSESSAAPSDAEKVTDAEDQKPAEATENGGPPKKKKIIKKKIVIKKVVRKKKKVPEEPAAKPEASNATLNNNYTESESEADSRPASKLQNHGETESEREDKEDKEAEDPEPEKKIPPPVLPKTSRVSGYSGYTPSSSGYNNSRYGGYSSRYSRY